MSGAINTGVSLGRFSGARELVGLASR
jgi:hypothetical protein